MSNCDSNNATTARGRAAPLLVLPPFSLPARPSSSTTTTTTTSSSSSNPSQQHDLSSVAQLLQGRKNIVVLTGAGISVSSGIPDFRSKQTGLYETLDTEVRYGYCL